jgi:hypothetical protein
MTELDVTTVTQYTRQIARAELAERAKRARDSRIHQQRMEQRLAEMDQLVSTLPKDLTSLCYNNIHQVTIDVERRTIATGCDELEHVSVVSWYGYDAYTLQLDMDRRLQYATVEEWFAGFLQALCPCLTDESLARLAELSDLPTPPLSPYTALVREYYNALEPQLYDPQPQYDGIDKDDQRSYVLGVLESLAEDAAELAGFAAQPAGTSREGGNDEEER